MPCKSGIMTRGEQSLASCRLGRTISHSCLLFAQTPRYSHPKPSHFQTCRHKLHVSKVGPDLACNENRTAALSIKRQQDAFHVQVLCSTVITRTKDGPPRFLAVSDASGRIYLITPDGNLAWEHSTGQTQHFLVLSFDSHHLQAFKIHTYSLHAMDH